MSEAGLKKRASRQRQTSRSRLPPRLRNSSAMAKFSYDKGIQVSQRTRSNGQEDVEEKSIQVPRMENKSTEMSPRTPDPREEDQKAKRRRVRTRSNRRVNSASSGVARQLCSKTEEAPLKAVAILNPTRARNESASGFYRCVLNSSVNNKSTCLAAMEKSNGNPSASSSEQQFIPQPRQGSDGLYFIGGNNGSTLIEAILNSYGWKRTKSKIDESWTLKWCELKSSINFHTIKEGEQLVNHIPNCEILTNKQGLLNSLNDYNRTYPNYKYGKVDFLPETYCLDDMKDRDKFISILKDGDVWICKPTGRNQGKGIFLLRGWDDYNKTLNNDVTWANLRGRPVDKIIQRYITNPLLVNTRKFDIRAYMLIASTVPYLVLYHKGYIRLSMNRYSTTCSSILTHLTNQYIQKKDPNYDVNKEETVWTMEKFNDYINKNVVPDNDLEENWVFGTLTSEMQRIMKICFDSVKNRLARKIGYFEIYGFDFIVDDSFKVWLLEININPSLATNCEGLKQVIPPTIKEAIDIALECFDKSKRKQHLVPLASQKAFEILHSPIISTPTAFSNTYQRLGARQNSTDRGEIESHYKASRKAGVNVNLSAHRASTKTPCVCKFEPPSSSSSTGHSSRSSITVLNSSHLKAFTSQLVKKSCSKGGKRPEQRATKETRKQKSVDLKLDFYQFLGPKREDGFEEDEAKSTWKESEPIGRSKEADERAESDKKVEHESEEESPAGYNRESRPDNLCSTSD